MRYHCEIKKTEFLRLQNNHRNLVFWHNGLFSLSAHRAFCVIFDYLLNITVRMERLELSRLAALAPKASVYTNFTTSAFARLLQKAGYSFICSLFLEESQTDKIYNIY